LLILLLLTKLDIKDDKKDELILTVWVGRSNGWGALTWAITSQLLKQKF